MSRTTLPYLVATRQAENYLSSFPRCLEMLKSIERGIDSAISKGNHPDMLLEMASYLDLHLSTTFPEEYHEYLVNHRSDLQVLNSKGRYEGVFDDLIEAIDAKIDQLAPVAVFDEFDLDGYWIEDVGMYPSL